MLIPNYLSELLPCAERMMDQGTCQICLQTLLQTFSTSPVRKKTQIIINLYKSYNYNTNRKTDGTERLKGDVQYSLNKTLESLCLAPV